MAGTFLSICYRSVLLTKTNKYGELLGDARLTLPALFALQFRTGTARRDRDTCSTERYITTEVSLLLPTCIGCCCSVFVKDVFGFCMVGFCFARHLNPPKIDSIPGNLFKTDIFISFFIHII